MAGLGLDWLSDGRRNKQTLAIFAALVGASLLVWATRQMVGLGRLAPVPALWLGIVAMVLLAFLLYMRFARRIIDDWRTYRQRWWFWWRVGASLLYWCCMTES